MNTTRGLRLPNRWVEPDWIGERAQRAGSNEPLAIIRQHHFEKYEMAMKNAENAREQAASGRCVSVSDQGRSLRRAGTHDREAAMHRQFVEWLDAAI
jgi:hypothetical protein